MSICLFGVLNGHNGMRIPLHLIGPQCSIFKCSDGQYALSEKYKQGIKSDGKKPPRVIHAVRQAKKGSVDGKMFNM